MDRILPRQFKNKPLHRPYLHLQKQQKTIIATGESAETDVERLALDPEPKLSSDALGLLSEELQINHSTKNGQLH